MKLLKLANLILILLLISGCSSFETENAKIANQIADEYTVATIVVENVLTLHTAKVLSDSDLQNLEVPIDQHKRSLDAASEALRSGDTDQAIAHLDVVSRLSNLLNTYLNTYWENYYESAHSSATSKISD